MAKIDKIEAASRLLNTAISLLFADGERIAIHTLTAAASNIFSDVLDKEKGAQSWREKLRIDHGLSEAEIRNVMHSEWNFFKHANRDPDEVLEFDEKKCEYMIFFATLECGELQQISIQMQIFQLWFLARGVLDLGADNEIQKTAKSIFPNLEDLPWSEQLRIGKTMLAKEIKDFRE